MGILAKKPCAICGVEVGLTGQVKLADGNYICRKVCQKKAMHGYDFMHGNLPALQEHIAQVERDTETFKKFLWKAKPKSKFKQIGGLRVYEDLGLIARVSIGKKFFIFVSYVDKACIYRIADLYAYEYDQGSKSSFDLQSKTSKSESLHFCHYYFWDTPGLSDFAVRISKKGDQVTVEKYFNKLYGIEKTLRNIGNTWKNQINAVKAAGSAVKAAATGSDDLEEKAGAAADAMERAQYGDRSVWKARADATLAAWGVKWPGV